MARRKQMNPMQRIPSGEIMQTPPDYPDTPSHVSNGHITKVRRSLANGAAVTPIQSPPSQAPAGLAQLVVCVAGIYASFLSWALLQERITTTAYPAPVTFDPASPVTEFFRFPVVLNTIQSFFASFSGTIYLFSTWKKSSGQRPSIFPTNAIILPLLLVSISYSLASPFGYASLAHVDYLTFVLAKSCKLLPVMFLHITLFRKRYPLSKYVIILTVTAGVALFTISHPPSSSKPKAKASSEGASTSSIYGLVLLSINLLLDGLTNAVQDHIFSSPARYGKFSGPQMMVAQNIIGTLLTSAYLVLLPLVPDALLPSAIAIPQEGNNIGGNQVGELGAALVFLQRHPRVLYDVLGFAACGAVGQLFIFATLERFSSLLLVTVTVTRKMLTMLLSVVWFGKRLTSGQWAGVGLVFGGVGAEGWIQRSEKKKKEMMKSSKKVEFKEKGEHKRKG